MLVEKLYIANGKMGQLMMLGSDGIGGGGLRRTLFHSFKIRAGLPIPVLLGGPWGWRS